MNKIVTFGEILLRLILAKKLGKKRMKQVGKVELPQEAFMAVLKIDTND